MFTVTMRNSTTDDSGTLWEFEVIDHVPADDLNRYVTDARTRWSTVDVAEENQEN